PFSLSSLSFLDGNADAQQRTARLKFALAEWRKKVMTLWHDKYMTHKQSHSGRGPGPADVKFRDATAQKR
ncbi:hypothetical protein LXA31_17865, partial [Erwinia amylovora]|uniref:hypothetical protein n=1 Tax=Erwinia amylovora TaxID=552 RepID=UPI0020C01829